jgi:hypothetical protein
MAACLLIKVAAKATMTPRRKQIALCPQNSSVGLIQGDKFTDTVTHTHHRDPLEGYEGDQEIQREFRCAQCNAD